MSEYTRTVPKNLTDADATLELVLEVIIFQTKDGDELVKYQNNPTNVVLTFDGI